jgi:sec-independent protein translocase protein TatA
MELPELIIVLLLVLLLFGGSRLPRLARSFAEAQRELRKSQRDEVAGPVTKPLDEPGPPR